jgi:hypothetical protein
MPCAIARHYALLIRPMPAPHGNYIPRHINVGLWIATHVRCTLSASVRSNTVKNIGFAQEAGQQGLDDRPAARDALSRFTPGRFFAEAGSVIAVCLGLGLLARILVN